MGKQIVSLIDVRQFGAQGDGVNDDAPAFAAAMQALIDFQGGKGASVGLPPGRYRFASAVAIPLVAGGSVTFEGTGDDAVIVLGPSPSTANFNGFTVADGATAWFQNLRFEGPSAGAHTVLAVQKLGSTGDVGFINVTALNVARAGVSIPTGCRLVLGDCAQVGNDYAARQSTATMTYLGDGLWGGTASTQPQTIKGFVDPSAGAGVAAPEGSYYQRYQAGVGEMWLKAAAADTGWLQLLAGGGGGVTLDGAYDFGGPGVGRAIVADAGAVTIGSTAADNNNILEITKAPVGAQSGAGITVAMNANTTGAGISVTQLGSGTAATFVGRVVASSVRVAVGTAAFYEAADGSTAAVSAANEGRLRYNQPTQRWQVSMNAAAYVDLTTGAGGGTLDTAYDFGGAGLGRAITADAGAVTITNNAANNNNVLEITKNPAGPQSGEGITITMGANAGSAGIGLVAANGPGMEVTCGAANTGGGIAIYMSGAATSLSITNNHASGVGIDYSDNTAGTQPALQIVRNNGGSGALINLDKSPGAPTAGNLVVITAGANSTGDAISITAAGQGDALDVSLTSSALARALVVTSSVATSVAILSVTSSTTAATGNLLALTKSPGGATAGDLVLITAGANTSGSAISIAHSGSGDAINIALATTVGAQALVVTASQATTNPLIEVTQSTPAANGSLVTLTRSPGSGATTGRAIDIAWGLAGGAGWVLSGPVIGITGVATGASVISGSALSVTWPASSTASGIFVNTFGSGTAGVEVICQSSSSSIGVSATMNGSGGAAFYGQVGGANGISFRSVVNVASGQVLVSTDPGLALTNANGLVQISVTTTGTTAPLINLNKVPAGSTGGNAMLITMGANTTGNGISIPNSGSGDAINVTLATSTGAQALVVNATVATANPMLEVTQNTAAANGSIFAITRSPASGTTSGSGIVMVWGQGAGGTISNGSVPLDISCGFAGAPTFDNDFTAVALRMGSPVANGYGIYADINGAGTRAFYAVISSTTGKGLEIISGAATTDSLIEVTSSTTAATGALIQLTKSPGGATAGDLMTITAGANASGNSISITQSGSGDAINIALGSSTTAQAAVIASSVATTTTLVDITSSTTGATGVLLALTKSPGGATAGSLMAITGGANASGDALNIAHAGGKSLNVTAGQVALFLPSAAPADGTLANSQWTVWVNEAGALLTFKVKDSAGVVKSGTVAIA